MSNLEMVSDDYERGWSSGYKRGKEQLYAAFRKWYLKNVLYNKDMIGESIREDIIDQLIYSGFNLEEVIHEYLFRVKGIFPTQITTAESREIADTASSFEEEINKRIEKGIENALKNETVFPQVPQLHGLIDQYS